MTGSGGELDALKALQAALQPTEFWNPRTLDQIPGEAVEVFLDGLVEGKRGLRGRLSMARELRGLSAAERIEVMERVLSGAPREEAIRRGLAWAAGLPLEVMGRLSRGKLALPSDSTLSWLPEGLRVKALFLSGCRALRSLPEDLEVELLWAHESGLESLPTGLVIQGEIGIFGTPLARFSDAEIRAMAPGVTGRIVR